MLSPMDTRGSRVEHSLRSRIAVVAAGLTFSMVGACRGGGGGDERTQGPPGAGQTSDPPPGPVPT